MIRTVAIPGCLRADQNARLDQEGQIASIKEPRSPTIKNKAKEELFTAGEGEQDGEVPPLYAHCAQLYSTEGSSRSLDIVFNHHKMGWCAC